MGYRKEHRTDLIFKLLDYARYAVDTFAPSYRALSLNSPTLRQCVLHP